MIVLDARILIAHLANNDAHHERATRLLVSLAGQPKTMSVLTRAEVLVGPARAGRRRAAEDILDQLRIGTCEAAARRCRAAGRTAGTYRPADAGLLRTAHLRDQRPSRTGDL